MFITGLMNFGIEVAAVIFIVFALFLTIKLCDKYLMSKEFKEMLYANPQVAAAFYTGRFVGLCIVFAANFL